MYGKTTISGARNAAEAWRPFAGDGAYWLFSLGLTGAGMLAFRYLVGSCAYVIAEAADWVGSLEVHPPLAHRFYAVIAIAMALGLGLGLDAVKMLFRAAAVNGTMARATDSCGAAHQRGHHGRAPEQRAAPLAWMGVCRCHAHPYGDHVRHDIRRIALVRTAYL